MEGFFVSFLKMKQNNLQASKRFGALFFYIFGPKNKYAEVITLFAFLFF